jgi:RNA polymerase sigma factor (sigma-70 family)
MHAPGDEHGALSWEVAQTATRQALRRWPRLSKHREEVLSDACLGVTLARNSFDPERGVAFFTYALYRARGQILDGLRHRAPLTRDQVAKGLEPPPDPRSLDPIAYRIPDQRRPLEDFEDRDELEGLLARLPERLAFVLREVDLHGHPLAAVGLALGVTESRVCQLRKQALALLR